MTQPPYGDMQPPPGEPTPYPRQELLPQRVAPGRSRLPLAIGAVAIVLALVGGLLAWWLLRDDGEQNRAAYCDAVATITHGGNLQAAASGGPAANRAALARARDLAPSAVRSQWDDLVAIIQGPSNGQLGVATGLRLISDVRSIVADANANCGMHITLPFS